MIERIKRSWSILLQTVPGASRSVILFAGIWLLLSSNAPAVIDFNTNGVSDLWEEDYNDANLFTNFDLQADPDGDGWSNAREAAAGTNPFDGNPPTGFIRPEIEHIPAVYQTPEEEGGEPTLESPEALRIRWPTLAGKTYALFFSVDLSPQTWLPYGGTRIGSGSILGADIPLTQPDGSIPQAMFLRVAIGDTDTDGDGLTDAEEHAVGSSPYFADTNGNGIDDGLELRAGNNPSAGVADGNGDGIPDNEVYSVVFEVQQEGHNVNSTGPYYPPFADSANNFLYLTSKDIEIFSRSGAALFPDVTEAKRTVTYTYLSNGEVLTYNNSQIEYPPPQGPINELGVGESYESDPTQASVVGPTTTPAEVKTVTTRTTLWRIKKQETTIRTGTQTDVNTVQKTLSDGLTYQDFWATYVKPLAFTEYIEGIYGPAEPANYLRSAVGDVWAAEAIRNFFRNGNFQLDGMISSPSQGYFGTYGEDSRLKRIRWRWVRFNPSKPFDYEYAAPPADYRKDFYIRVEQTDELGDRSKGYGQQPDVSTKETKGIIKIECAGSEGSNWKEIPMGKFNTYKIADPTSLATMNYTKWGYSWVRMSLTPLEVAVDYNRDGEISFDGQDKNTVEKPFRFWVNNDQDDVEADEPIEVEPNDRDWLDNTIATKRDLEDFCRLKVNAGISLGELINGNIRVGLKFVDTASGNPKIKVWPNQSASGDADYLTDLTAAQTQISKSPFSINNGVILIPSSYWVQSGNSTANLIFEGETEGLAKLVVVIQNKNGTEIC